MLICQWHLDILYGKQANAVKIMRGLGSREVRQLRVQPGGLMLGGRSGGGQMVVGEDAGSSIGRLFHDVGLHGEVLR
jgi:hypothetical protein